ncbi:MAG: ABC transporter ATP-binding protein, partial [Oscillospiraceae bacterium]|nr:ABC transporter ATP-binding protein [Oscillospiraceae bacterium]
MEQRKPKGLLARFLGYYRPYKLLFGTDIFMSSVITATSLIYPLITRRIINEVVPSGDFAELIRCVILVFAVYTVKLLATYWVSFYGHMMGVDIQNDMQRDLFTHMLTLPYRFFDEHKSGVLMSRIVNDLNGISELAHHGPENLLQT